VALSLNRTLPEIAYGGAAGAVSSFDLPRDHVMAGLRLMLNLTLTTSGAPAAGTEVDQGILAAIRRLEITADGGVTVYSIDPLSLYIANALWNGAPGQRDDLAPPAMGATTNFQAFLHLPFALPFAKNPNLTLLNAAALSSFRLNVTWGGIADLYQTVNTTTIVTASTFITPETEEVVGLDPRSVFSLFRVSQVTKDVTAAADRLTVELPRGNVIRGLLLRAKVSTNGIQDETDGIVNQVDIESSERGRGVFVHRRQKATETAGTARNGYTLRNACRRIYGLNDLVTVETGQQDLSLTGMYPIEFMENQRVTGAVRTQDFTSFNAVLNVSAPATSPQVIANVFEIIPAAAPRAA
jgi:hypothetical protein